MATVTELFKSITIKQSTWIGILTAKLGNRNDAMDIYQDVNLKLLSLIHNDKIYIENIVNSRNEINYAYYYRMLINSAIDFLKTKRIILVELTPNMIFEDEEPEIKEFPLCKSIVGDQSINGLDVLVRNQLGGVALHEIATERNTNLSAIFNLKTQAINEIRNKYGEVKEA